MRIREAHDGELTVFTRAEWEYRFGPLPSAFKGDKVHIDKRQHPVRTITLDGRKFSYSPAELLPQGIPFGEGNSDDHELAAEVTEIMGRQLEAEADFHGMFAEALQRKFGRGNPEGIGYDVMDEVVTRWKRERGTDPPVHFEDEYEVPS